jgi:hypothetical protein
VRAPLAAHVDEGFTMLSTLGVRFLRWLAAIALCLPALAGCAIGRQHDYRVRLPPPLEGSGRIAIAVHDQRPDVVSGSEAADYVGVSRSGYGIPFDVVTDSGLPLSEDWAAAVASAMRRGGFRPVVVHTTPQQSRADVIRRLHATRASAMMLFVVYRWHADTFMDVSLHHDVVLAVTGPNGALLGHARSTGEEDLGGDAFNAYGHASEAVPLAFKRKVEWLLGDRRVIKALEIATRGPSIPAGEDPPVGFAKGEGL